MKLEYFQLKDNKTIDISIIKRYFIKTYPQQEANLKDSDQSIEFNFGESKSYHQVGNAYLPYELTIEKNVAVAANRVQMIRDAIRLVKNAFA